MAHGWFRYHCRNLKFLQNGGELPIENHTFIALIPKMKNPVTPKDFRPISLCNVLYKIIAKTLANRLKYSLSELISLNQSAFVPRRQIFDNALIAYETIHYLKMKKNGENHQMAMKLDMSKAYDRVEWCYLERVLRRLGFSEKWISLLMMCMRTVS